MPGAAPDRVLIVDDDPVCRRFATEVLAAAGYGSAECGTVAAARSALGAGGFACLVCDLGLPDGSGLDLLGPASAARVALIAMSAELPPARRDELIRRGASAALQKPVRAADLLDAVTAALSGRGTDAARPATASGDALLDDGAALDVAGAADIVAGLRMLLRGELPLQRAAMLRALDEANAGEARAVLHRLRAACGFCGATRLQREAALLADALLDGGEHDAARLRFVDALDATLAALDARGAPPP